MRTKPDSSNAAKLYIHHMLAEEGFAFQLAAPDDPSGVKDFLDQMAPFPSADLVSDYRTKSEWDDVWRNSHS